MAKQKKRVKPDRNERKARYFKLSYQRSRAVYNQHIALERWGKDSKLYQLLEKQIPELNAEIEKLEIELKQA